MSYHEENVLRCKKCNEIFFNTSLNICPKCSNNNLVWDIVNYIG